MKRALLAVIVFAVVPIGGMACAQTFKPAAFVHEPLVVEKLDRAYCLEKLDQQLFKRPSSVAVIGQVLPGGDRQRRFMFATDDMWGRVVFGEEGEYISAFGSYGMHRREFRRPTSIEVDPFMRVYVADHSNCRVDILSMDPLCCPGRLTIKDVATYAAPGETLAFPIDLAWDDGGTPTDSTDDFLWVLSDFRNKLHKYRILATTTPPVLQHVYSYGSYAGGPGGFNSPWAVVKGRSNSALTPWDSYNNDLVYVADRFNKRIVQLRERPDGSGLDWVKAAYPVDPAVRPNYVSVEVDCWGNVYAVDIHNCQIVKLTSDLECLTTYGIMGTGTMAGEFMYPKDFQIYFYLDRVGADEEHPAGRWVGTPGAVVLESWSDETGFQGLSLGAEVVDVSVVADVTEGTVVCDAFLTDHCLLSAKIERDDGAVRKKVRTIFADSASASGHVRVVWDGKDDAGNLAQCGDYYMVFQPVSLYDRVEEFEPVEATFTIPSSCCARRGMMIVR